MSDVDQVFAAALQQHQAGQLSEAERGYRQILEAFPEHSDALNLLGVVALQTGNPESALDLVQRAVALRPDGGIYRSNLGQVLERLNRLADAERSYREAIDYDPECAEAFNNLGHLLQRQGQLAEARQHFETAIRLNPAYAEPRTNIGNLLKDCGDLDGAIEAYRRAIELRPDLSMLHSNLLLALHYHPGSSPESLAYEHRLWANRHVAPLAAGRAEHDNDAVENRRLRIGYVSPDFRDHAVARFLLPLLQNHDRQKIEVFAYSDVDHPDAVTAELRSLSDHWREISGLGDEQVANAVRHDRIDILVDLAAHSGRNRLLVFARKPAPVQMTYLAYCSTTGVDAIDYRLTDRFLDPPAASDEHYTERSLRLTHCYWCYSAPASAGRQAPSLDRLPGPPTFGCLNNFAKVTDAALQLWMELLRRFPESRLLLYARADAHQQRVRSVLNDHALDESRAVFVGWQPLESYLETYRSIDVALDPFPYTGGTTSCDALWMGVPVVTLSGRTAVARGGATLLSNLGLPELIANDEAQYLNIAGKLMGDGPRRAHLRSELRARLEASPIMDAPRFVAGIESAYRQAWRAWCGRSPDSR